MNNSAYYETTYTHDVENRPTQLRFGADNRKISYVYDPIGRLSQRVAVGAVNYTTNYAYLGADPSDPIRTTPLVTSITQNGQSFAYSYDNVGNIIAETRNGLTTTYVYDNLGQLIRVNDPHAGKSTVYVYDRGGNITSYSEYAYTTGTLGAATKTVGYTYGDANWKDKVTAIGGKAITYDAIGNPLTYDGWTFTWKAGRMLASMVKTGTNAQFTYDHNGLRLRKVVNGVTTNYTLSGKNIVHMTQGSNDLHFFYDAQGKPAMVRFNGTDYFYIYNLQGDVLAIIDINGTQVVEYHYDAWGNPVAKTGSMAASLGTLNPFRYRGYIFDEETWMYYLKDRYYYPELRRFINSDRLTGCVGVNLSHNLFAYCVNSPIMHKDPKGLAPAELSAPPEVPYDVVYMMEQAGYSIPEFPVIFKGVSPSNYREITNGLITVEFVDVTYSSHWWGTIIDHKTYQYVIDFDQNRYVEKAYNRLFKNTATDSLLDALSSISLEGVVLHPLSF